MRRAHCELPALLALASAACGNDLGIQQSGIVHGWTDEDPGRAVAVHDPRAGALCSGVALAPTVVLTARHCVLSDPDGVVDPARLVVWVGPHDLDVRASSRVRSIVVPPGRVDSFADLRGRDVALLELDEALPVAVSALVTELGDDWATDLVWVEGFGSSPGGIPGVRRQAATRVVALTVDEVFTEPVTCDADSGAALFTRAGEVVGVASYRSPGPCGLGSSAFSLVRSHAAWIEEVVARGAEACAGGACVARARCDLAGTCAGEDQPCELDVECGSGTCIDGRCGYECDPILAGSLCPSERSCVVDIERGTGLCRPLFAAPGGASCEAGSQCVSGACDAGRCAHACRPDASHCPDGAACRARSASLGVCDASPTSLSDLGGPCEDGVDCASGHCQEDGRTRYCSRGCDGGALCPSGYRCHAGRCMRGTQETGDSCDEQRPCPPGLECVRSACARRCFLSEECGPRGECVDGLCVAPLGVGASCAASSDCASGVCAGGRCAQACGYRRPCAVGFVCAPGEDERRCVPREPDAVASSPSCGVGSTDRHVGSNAVVFVLGLAARLRLHRGLSGRRAQTRKETCLA